MEVGEREIKYLSPHCHHQNDSCIKMGSDESHFNVSLIVRDKVTRLYLQTTAFLKRKESRSGFEPRSFCLPALPLGQTGSHTGRGGLHVTSYGLVWRKGAGKRWLGVWLDLVSDENMHLPM